MITEIRMAAGSAELYNATMQYSGIGLTKSTDKWNHIYSNSTCNPCHDFAYVFPTTPFNLTNCIKGVKADCTTTIANLDQLMAIGWNGDRNPNCKWDDGLRSVIIQGTTSVNCKYPFHCDVTTCA